MWQGFAIEGDLFFIMPLREAMTMNLLSTRTQDSLQIDFIVG